MPNVRPLTPVLVALALASHAATAQQPDSVARADSLRADSARADSVRRAERRAPADTLPAQPSPAAAATGMGVGGLMLTLTGEGVADLSPRAAARAPGSRLRAGDVRVALNAMPTRRLRADVSMTFRNDSTPQITTAALTAELVPARLFVRIGRQPVPFGIAAPRQRVDLWFPDHPLPVRAFLGQRGIRATGAMATAMQVVAGIPFALRLGIFDRFGDRIDSLVTPEPADQSIVGLSGFARLSADVDLVGARLTLGASTISGKREQPITCVYQATVGPVLCPNGISGANTRMSVMGADGLLTAGTFSVEGEWVRNVVGATDFPVFDQPGFAAYYTGMYGTYDGAYLQARWNGPGIFRVGARAETTQNPAVAGLNDRAAGAFVGLEPMQGSRIVLSYLRRLPSAQAKERLDAEDRAALDRIVLRGTIALGWLLQKGER